MLWVLIFRYLRKGLFFSQPYGKWNKCVRKIHSKLKLNTRHLHFSWFSESIVCGESRVIKLSVYLFGYNLTGEYLEYLFGGYLIISFRCWSLVLHGFTISPISFKGCQNCIPTVKGFSCLWKGKLALIQKFHWNNYGVANIKTNYIFP